MERNNSNPRGERALRFALLLLALLAALGTAFAQQDAAAWDRVLRPFVTDAGRVNYAALKAHPEDLERFLATLRTRSPLSDPGAFAARESQLAYWINAYNALVIAGVVEAWPVASVRRIGALPFSFFWRKKFTVGGHAMTLGEIEGLLRKQLGDPRIHFAIVCASLSCPRLAREAYRPERVNEQLDRAAREFINDPRNVRIDTAGNRVKLSRIFRWYRGDFAAAAASERLPGRGDPVLRYIRRYADRATRGALDRLHNPHIDYFSYDWGINALAPPKP